MKYFLIFVVLSLTGCVGTRGELYDPVMTGYNLLSDYVKSTGYKLPNKKPRTVTYVNGNKRIRGK